MTVEETDQTQQAEPVNDGGGAAEVIDNSESSTQGQEGSDLGVKDLPEALQAKEKELMREFHAKTQALSEKEKALTGEAETYKGDAQAFYNLSRQEWFKQAVEAEKARRSGAATEISDEVFEAAKNDKRAFSELLSKREKAIAADIEAKFQEKFDRLGKSQGDILAEREVSSAASKYGDEFTEAKESGALKPYLAKDHDHDTAFILYMQSQGKVAGKPKGDPATVRSGAIEKTGMVKAKGGPVMRPKNLGDALDRAFDLAKRGVKDYRFERE